MPQPIGKDEETKGIGDNKDHKDEWPKDPGIWTMHALIVDKLDTMLGIVHKDGDATLSPTSLTLTMKNKKNDMVDYWHAHAY